MALPSPLRNRIGTEIEPGSLAPLAIPPPAGGIDREAVAVAVVGAGPAGMAAALTLAATGVPVLLLAERTEPGGQYFKPLAASHRFAAGRAADRQFAEGRARTGQLAASTIDRRQGATVWSARRLADDRLKLGVVQDGRAFYVRARQLILATGAVERPLMVPGWTLPGVMTTGAAQTRVTPGERVLGRGPIIAGRVVVAAGAWSRPVAARLGIDVPVFGAPLQMIVTEPAPPLVDQLVAHVGRHLTLKQAGNGNLIIGGGWPAELDPATRHPRARRDRLEGNLWVARRVLPALDRLHILRSWGAINVDIDGAPILGAVPTVPGLLLAVTSNGYTLGPIMGRLTADVIGGAPSASIAGFGLDRFH